MMIEISMKKSGNGRFYEVATENVAMSLSVFPTWVSACVDNSSSRTWRRHGKVFHGANALDRVAAAYKSSACKAMVQAVIDAERALAMAPTVAA